MLRILIIDDETRRMQATVELLEMDGFLVTQIDSPGGALSELSRRPAGWDIIVLDIMMPPDEQFDLPEVKDGLRTGFLLLQKFREIPELVCPVIILTANAEFCTEVEAMGLSFLKKPAPYELLKAEIMKRANRNKQQKGGD